MSIELHTCIPPSFSQCAKPWIMDPTWWPLCCKHIMHQKTFPHLTSNCIFMCKRGILASKGSKISSPLQSYKSSTSIFIVIVIVVAKASNNNQWPLINSPHKQYNMIKGKCEYLNNSPHLGFRYPFLYRFLLAITNNYSILKLKSFFKHINDLLGKYGFHGSL